MRCPQLVFAVVVVGCTGRPQPGKVPSTRTGVQARDEFEQSVEKALFLRRTSRDVQTELSIRSESWTPDQKRRAARIALAYLKPRYADWVHEEVMRLAAWEGVDGHPQLRKWLRANGRATDEGTVRVMALVLSSSIADKLPERFDILSFWINSWTGSQAGSGWASVCLYVPVGREMACREWWTWDAAAEAFRSAFRDHMPAVTHSHPGQFWESTDKEKSSLLTEWREHMPRWLREHPEARSWWIQRFYHGCVNRRDRMVGDGRFADVLPRVETSIASLEREFPEELADRRGICANAEWNRPTNE